jgi:hypothetical protein
MADLDEREREAQQSVGTGTAPATQAPVVGKTTQTEQEAPRTTKGPYKGHTYRIEGENKTEKNSFQRWNAVGKGGEYELADTDKSDDAKKVTNPGVATADLSRVEVDPTRSWEGENGIYKESVFGTYFNAEDGGPQVGGKANVKNIVTTDGALAAVTLGRRSVQAGAGERVGVRGSAKAENELGTATASGDAYATAQAGASGNMAVSGKGLDIGGAASVKAMAAANADVELKTKGLKLDGVDKALDAGVGAHGDVAIGARAGVGGRVGLNKDFVGAEVSAGGFVGAEAAGNIHANLGPLSVKAGVSGIAGAGAAIDGGIVWEKGKIKLRGKALAAFGLGGSANVTVEIDVQQAIQLGILTAKKAAELADANHDGAVTLSDGATHASNALVGGAKGVDSAVDSTLKTADANKDGKLGMDDVGIHASNAWEGTKNLGSAAWEGTKNLGSAAVDGTKNAWEGAKNLGSAAVDGAKNLFSSDGGIAKATDVDGDGKITMADAKAAIDGVGQGLRDVSETVRAQGHALLKHAHTAADIDGDGKLGIDDAKIAANAVKDKAGALYNTAVDAGSKVVKTLETGTKAAGRKLHAVADRDGDGKVGVNDLHVGVQQANKKVTAAVAVVKEKAQKAKEVVAAAADRNGDGKVDAKDVAVGAAQAKQAVSKAVDTTVATSKKLVADAKKELHEAKETLSKGIAEASSIASGTFAKLKGYFK